VTTLSTSVGGAKSTGGSHATGGVAVNTGGALAGTTGGASAAAQGGTSSNPAGGANPATGGSKPGTGGAPATGGASTGDAGSTCASGYAFCDNFESYAIGAAAGTWVASSGSWSVVTDTTVTAGDQKVYSNAGTGNAVARTGTTAYTNASIEARIRVVSFSSTSASNSAGVFLRSNGTNDYDFSLGGDGKVYLRREPGSSTEESCTGTTSAASGVTVSSTRSTGWFRLKLTVAGTVAAGTTLTGFVDATASGTFTQVVQCTQAPGTSYMIDTGTAGVFAKGSAPANYDDVAISAP